MAHRYLRYRFHFPCFATAMAVAIVMGVSQAQETESEAAETLEEVEVIGTTPTHGVGLPEEMIPANVQSATRDDLERAQGLDLTDFMNRNFGNVTINAAQNNPLQPDVQYRGYTASPLLGLPQGLAVYVDGVRVNEVFGDTVNWDLIPDSIIDSINLFGGANPLFGQNTLGGALSIRTKNGFIAPGHSVDTSGGSFGRVITSGESGGNNGTWGYFANVRYFEESGWRDESDSDALNLFGTLSWRGGERSTIDLHLAHGDTMLTGNGASPAELLAQDRSAFFTAPDITENNLQMVNLEGLHFINERLQLSGNAYYRTNDTESFNGDGTPFVECDDGVNKGLVEEDDFTDRDGSGECDAAGEVDPADLLVDQNGNIIDDDFGAVNNISEREQESYGVNAQTTFLHDLFGHENQLIVGAAWNEGLLEFGSRVEVANLGKDRITDRSGLFAVNEDVGLDAKTRTVSAFFTDTFSITEAVAMTVSGRYNATRLKLSDTLGNHPELAGDHSFTRFNPAVGLTWQVARSVNVYGGYSESARAPTAVELSCADPDAPCILPNAFLADPPLAQVAAKGVEGGVRGQLFDSHVDFHLGGFHAINKDDILFQVTGGATSNQGFFANVGDTRRVGMELGLNGSFESLNWFMNYGLVHATFEDSFIVGSPNHPNAVDLNGDGEAGEIQVEEGDRIPSIPQHTVKFGADYAITDAFSVGGDVQVASGQYLRGDESNDLDTTDAYAVVNLRGSYRVNKHVQAYASVENVFDTDFETFGLLGEADEVFPNFTDNRFFGAGAPIGGWVGVKLSY